MADNVAITPGTGATVAADEIGGVLHQRIKMGLGADGAATDAVGGAGAVSAAVQRVTLASDDPAVAVLGTTTGAAVVTDANGTIQQYLRGIVVRILGFIGPKASSASLSVSNSFLTAAALGDGSVDTAETIAVANTVQVVEFFNLSANVIWASWTGTAAAGTTGSFPIPALASGVAGYYSSPPGASGSLSIIAVGGASVFTCIGWS